MFIPLIIAILMGLVTPTTNHANCNSGTVYVSNSGTNPDEDPGTGGEEGDGGEDGPGTGTGTGGDTGQIPPPKP